MILTKAIFFSSSFNKLDGLVRGGKIFKYWFSSHALPYVQLSLLNFQFLFIKKAI